MIETAWLKSPVGFIKISASEKGIVEISFSRKANAAQQSIKNSHLQDAVEELKEYFEGSRRTFSFALAPSGTRFQQKVWRALCQIPFGETRAYKEIAASIKSPKSARAVGMANNKNPIAIVVPCHRVIGANLKLVGYAGGLYVKRWLLRHEERMVLSSKSAA